MVWVDESSSVGEQMTVSSHKEGNLSTGRVRKGTLPYNSMVAKFHSIAFSNFKKVLKAHLHWSGAYCVRLPFSLLSAPFLGINKTAPAQSEKSE